MTSSNLELKYKVYYVYTYFVKFFEDYAQTISAASILYSMYCIGVQLGVEMDKESLYYNKQFNDMIDSDDFKNITISDINALDVITSNAVNELFISDVENDELWFCGVHTLVNLGLNI